MRSVREVITILGTIALAGFAGYGLAFASAELSGGIDGWEGVIAIIYAGFALFVALVSSALATLVVRRRSWRIAFVAVTLVGAVYLGLGAFTPGRSSGEVLGEAAIIVSLALALWLPVGARWWLESLVREPVPAEKELSSRAAVIAGISCAAVVVIASTIVVAVVGSALPGGLAGFALVLVVAAALASGRVPEAMALALLAGVGVCAVLFGLPTLPEGGLITAALAVVVLVAFSWRPFAVRLSAARRATPELPLPPATTPEPEGTTTEGPATAPSAD